MNPLLTDLKSQGVLSPLDQHFAQAIAALDPGCPESVLLALAVVSARTRQGHVCARLSALAGHPMLEGEGTAQAELAWPALDPWLEALSKSPLVGDGHAPTPLVLDHGDRLYLYRYWQHERALARELELRAVAVSERLDYGLLEKSLVRFFDANEPDAQRDAALIACFRKLCIVTGGPGTGKTHTVARILALLTEQRLARNEPAPKTLAIAPTGKAAARLAESIERAKQNLDVSDEILGAVSSDARTIHRALGTRRGSSTHFVHNAENPLNADIVLVDETSMVDVALMRRLLEAVPMSARLVLLGDRHQLASVEAGSVLADICGSRPHPGYSPELVARVRELCQHALRERPGQAPNLVDSIVELSTSHRFDDKSGIAAFARAVNAGDGAKALSIASHGSSRDDADLALRPGSDARQVLAQLERVALPALARTVSTPDPETALALLDEFRVLCAHRRGPLGVTRVNERLEAALARKGLLSIDGPHYLGRPVMVLRNDHALGLFNGDIGVILNDESGTRRAFFRDGPNSLRKISPVRLPPHETSFAMSIHKSQGSEFSEVAIVLPEADSPLLTRELLYTAVTRARRRALLLGDAQCIEVGAGRPVARASGLEALLHG